MIDAGDLRQVWEKHGDRLLLIARAIGEPAEDAVQEAFVALARQPRLPTDPLAWLVRVTRNALRQHHRARLRRAARETRVRRNPWFACPETSVDDRLDAEVATAALRRLPEEQREAIVMHLWGGMTFEAIGDVTAQSRATTHRHYRRGIEALQRELDGELSQTAHRADFQRNDQKPLRGTTR